MSIVRSARWCSKGKGPGGLPLCYCGCGREVLKRNRTTFEAACWDKWAAVNHPPTVRKLVEKRDHGVCAKCGTDTEKLRAEYRRQLLDFYKSACAKNGWQEHTFISAETVEHLHLSGTPTPPDGFPDVGRSWWDADHIVPVVEGGGQCGLDGYQTLCCACHKKATASLAGRRAVRRVSSNVGRQR